MGLDIGRLLAVVLPVLGFALSIGNSFVMVMNFMRSNKIEARAQVAEKRAGD